MYGLAMSFSTPTDTPSRPRIFLCLKFFMMTLSAMNESKSSSPGDSKNKNDIAIAS